MKRKTSLKTTTITTNRFNTASLDIYTLPIDVLIVGGGGGGGYYGGGGGAGGFLLFKDLILSTATGISNVIVGSGGAIGPTNSPGSNGGYSSVFGFCLSGHLSQMNTSF